MALEPRFQRELCRSCALMRGRIDSVLRPPVGSSAVALLMISSFHAPRVLQYFGMRAHPMNRGKRFMPSDTIASALLRMPTTTSYQESRWKIDVPTFYCWRFLGHGK